MLSLPLATSITGLGSGISLAVETTTGNGFDPLSLIGTTVTPVIVIILLLMGKLHTDGEVRRLTAELEQTRSELHDLNSGMVDRVIPALTRSTLVLESITPLLDPRVRRDVGGD